MIEVSTVFKLNPRLSAKFEITLLAIVFSQVNMKK